MTTLVLTLTIVVSLTVTDADLRPGHLTTVWWDEACDCRRVEYEPIADREPTEYNPGTTVHPGFTVAEAP